MVSNNGKAFRSSNFLAIFQEIHALKKKLFEVALFKGNSRLFTKKKQE
jgi:hypothetical protein